MKAWRKILFAAVIVSLSGYAYWKFAIPTHRILVQSELTMLGDMDDDRKWTAQDLKVFEDFTRTPSRLSNAAVLRLDLNQNGLIDPEDKTLLHALIAADGDPYAAEESARKRREPFPRPREFYRYVSLTEYQPRPLWALPYAPALRWLADLKPPARLLSYEDELDAAIYSEAVRFDQRWQLRTGQLLPLERNYAEQKLTQARNLHSSGDKFELLLALIELVEDAETLTTRDQPEITVQFLTFRDHLRELLASPLYADFATGQKDWRSVLGAVSGFLQSDLGLSYNFETLGPPRNLTNLENYLERVEWQYYKSSSSEENFRALIAFAQHEPRYLRSVSRTSRRMQDHAVANHNLPMVLLFREALRIERGDKKKAAGLLDEAIRIPFAWVKSLPRESLPGSLAAENFLLPGNKEDGADKSRHWNVFGALCLYKTPQEALDLALKREMKDLREGNYTEPVMREFIRDMIGNLNGMFHVMTINPALLDPGPGPNAKGAQ